MGQLKIWSSTTAWATGRWQLACIALLTAGFLWPQASVDPSVTLDSSWQAGLALARVHDLEWGPQVLFTYGPLGFMQNSAYYSYDQALAVTAYHPFVMGALFLGIGAALRLRHPPLTALFGAIVTTAVVAIVHIGHGSAPGLEYPELTLLAAVAWLAVPLLKSNPRRAAVLWLCIAVGAVAGLQLLIKFNIGVSIALIVFVTSVLLDWKNISRHCLTVISFGASVLIFWVLAGQRLQDLPAWLRYSMSAMVGYSEGMALPFNRYTAGVLILSLAYAALLVTVSFRGGTQIPRRLVIVAGLATALCARAAIGRSDIWHLYILVGGIATSTAIVPFSTAWRRVIALLIGLVLVGNSLGMVAAGYRSYDQLSLAIQAPRGAFDRLVTLAIPGRLNQRIEQAKAHQRALYAIPEHFLEMIGSATVYIEPNQTSAAWAYNLAWRPAPVFQTYGAYTPTLDGLNSESLTGGPEFVLSRLSPTTPAIDIDGRLGLQESPRYSRSLICNYKLEAVEGRWALFSRTSPHCGPLKPLSEVDLKGNQSVAVPAPPEYGMAVLVAIDLQPSIEGRLFQGTIAPVTVPTVLIDQTAYRLVAANAHEPFLISTPAAVAGTNLEIHGRNIGVGHAPFLDRRGDAARLRFYAVRCDPQTGEQQESGAIPLKAFPKTVIDSDGRWVKAIDNDGTYVVGLDILPGKYRNSGGPMCHWARLSGLDPDDQIQSSMSSGSLQEEVEIALSDTGFSTRNCGTWRGVLPN